MKIKHPSALRASVAPLWKRFEWQPLIFIFQLLVFFCKYLSNLFFLHSNNGTLQWREFIKCSIYAILNYDFFFAKSQLKNLLRDYQKKFRYSRMNIHTKIGVRKKVSINNCWMEGGEKKRSSGPR